MDSNLDKSRRLSTLPGIGERVFPGIGRRVFSA
jgi:hypothetical protein